jgi:hypothetical protein
MPLTAIVRPSCLDMAPEWIESLARSCPVSPGGVHQWLASLSRVFQLFGPGTDKILYWATNDCGPPAGQ